jgi:hypothetical protein
VAGVLRLLGLRQNGGAHAHISRTLKAFGIDTSHFQRYNPTSVPPRRTAAQILVRRAQTRGREKPHMLKRAMIESGVIHECVMCGNNGSWLGLPLTLEVDHIDGDFYNNELDNLRFLCPNCHRLTPNFAGRSTGRYSARNLVGELPDRPA